MIPAQIPADRGAWPTGLLDELRQFRQGDVVEGPPYFYWGNPERAVLGLTAQFAEDGEGVIEAADRFDYGLIATQTCDIAEEESERPSQPWIHLCPVYDAGRRYRPVGTGADAPDEELPTLLPGDDRKLIRAGRSQRYLWLPALPGGFWVADLRLLLPVEKGWLAGRAPIPAFENESQRRVELLDQLSAAEHRRLTRLPLAAVSPNTAWYGEDPYVPPA